MAKPQMGMSVKSGMVTLPVVAQRLKVWSLTVTGAGAGCVLAPGLPAPAAASPWPSPVRRTGITATRAAMARASTRSEILGPVLFKNLPGMSIYPLSKGPFPCRDHGHPPGGNTTTAVPSPPKPSSKFWNSFRAWVCQGKYSSPHWL